MGEIYVIGIDSEGDLITAPMKIKSPIEVDAYRSYHTNCEYVDFGTKDELINKFSNLLEESDFD